MEYSEILFCFIVCTSVNRFASTAVITFSLRVRGVEVKKPVCVLKKASIVECCKVLS